MITVWRGLTALVLALFASFSLAHDSRPIYIDIQETAAEQFAVQWKVPVSLPLSDLPEVGMPSSCQPMGERVRGRVGDAYTFSAHYECRTPLAGQNVGIVYPGQNPALSTLIRIDLLDGTDHTHILPPDQFSWRVPEQTGAWAIAYQYTLYGVEHIFAGIDHLLFVACLVFIARAPRRILLTVTGFTLSHSLTLAAATLGWLSPPVPPVEAAIALSIVFLAHEIAVSNQRSWTWRYPLLVSSSFGLLHGFGFASVLRDLGLPASDVPLALLFFNLGVELGQLMFIALLAAGAWLAMVALRHHHQLLLNRRIGSYLIGILASYWLLQRIAAF